MPWRWVAIKVKCLRPQVQSSNYLLLNQDLRPSNVLMKFKPLDGLSLDEVYDILGEPEQAKVALRDLSGQPATMGSIPRYLVYPVYYEAMEVEDVLEDVCIADFGQAFDATSGITRRSGITRPYAPPELVFDNAMGVAGDLWSLGCLIFETRLQGHIIHPNDLLSPSDDEYALTVTLVLGRLPDPWWKPWGKRHTFYADPDGDGKHETHGQLIEVPGMRRKIRPLDFEDPRSIKAAIVDSCYRRTHQGGYEKYQDVSEEETAQLVTLLEKLLRYVPEERVPTPQILDDAWFEM